MFEQELLFVLHQVRKQLFLDNKILINKVATLFFEISSLLVFDIQGLKLMSDDHLVQKHPMILVKK